MFFLIAKHLFLSDPSKQKDFFINDCEVVLNEDDIELPAFRKIFTKVTEKKNLSHQIQLFLSNYASDLMKMKPKERKAQTSLKMYRGDYHHGMHKIVQVKI